ncbi:MAG: alpha-L-fucosidase [Rikenellaceae bacterium]
MKRNIVNSFLVTTALFAMSCGSNVEYYPDISKTSSPSGIDIFKPDSASIAENYTIPDWFTDDKLGIFIHWGVYAVPAYGSEWYARWMYQKGSKINKFHEDVYGPLTEFGYKDFIPSFKAQNFDAAQWAKIFKESGARYVVPVAEHHDGFAMYQSRFNPWNSVEMGPKIDVIGELSKAIKAEGLIFGLSSHRAENAWFYSEGMNTPSDVRDTDISLYGARVPQPGGKGMTAYAGENEGSNEQSRKEWLLHMYELIDQYQPDLIWFDWTVGKYPFQPTFYKFMAYYYNSAKEWNREVVVNTKVGYGDNIQVFDIERGKSDRIRKYAWQTDTSIGKKSWSYTPDEENKSPNHVIDDFVDIVSKNGNLLLNIGPKIDGTITKEQQYVLRELGSWLKVNGEAIYDTRPWVRWGEGDSRSTAGYMTDNTATEYTAHDIRFTAKDDVLYATTLAWGDADIKIGSLKSENGDNIKIESVSMLGSDEKIDWNQQSDGLSITFPKLQPTEYAHVFKIGYSGVVYGDIQGDVVGNDIVVEHYIRNNTDKDVTVEVECTNNGKESKKTTLTIPAHKTILGSFDFVLSSEVNNLSLSINGKEISTKTISAKVQQEVHGKTKSVVHNTKELS